MAVTAPLSLGEILDRTIQLYRRNFLLFVGISVIPSAIEVLTSGGLSIYFTSQAPALQGTAPQVGTVIAFILIFLAFLFIGLPLLVAAFSLALSALNYAVVLRNRGEAATVRDSYMYGIRHFWRYLGIVALQFLFALVIPGAVAAGIIVIGSIAGTLLAKTGGQTAFAIFFGLLIFLLLLAFLAVCVWIWLYYCLAVPASVTEDTKVWPSMKRSLQLTKGTRGRIFVMYLLVIVLTLIIAYALTIPLDVVLKLTVYKSMNAMTLFTKPPLLVQIANLFISFLQRAFVMPIYAVALVLFYNDQRTRQEGYDIELLMAQAGWSTLPAPVVIEPVVESTELPVSPIDESVVIPENSPAIEPTKTEDTVE